MFQKLHAVLIPLSASMMKVCFHIFLFFFFEVSYPRQDPSSFLTRSSHWTASDFTKQTPERFASSPVLSAWQFQFLILLQNFRVVKLWQQAVILRPPELPCLLRKVNQVRIRLRKYFQIARLWQDVLLCRSKHVPRCVLFRLLPNTPSHLSCCTFSTRTSPKSEFRKNIFSEKSP